MDLVQRWMAVEAFCSILAGWRTGWLGLFLLILIVCPGSGVIKFFNMGGNSGRTRCHYRNLLPDLSWLPDWLAGWLGCFSWIFAILEDFSWIWCHKVLQPWGNGGLAALIEAFCSILPGWRTGWLACWLACWLAGWVGCF